jgi:Tol biopolymer transport system component
MTARDEYDRHLSAWLASEAPAREPELLLGEVLARTARTRRRPAWRFAERWIPMSTITSRLSPAAGIPWRPILVAGLLLIALVVGALLVAGSRRQQLAPPFGAAANGHVAYSVNGDLVAMDPKTGTTRTIVSGPESDSGPVYAGNGSKLAFVRGDDGNRQVWAADADGSNARKIAGPFAKYPGWIEWSPQADVVAVEIDEDGGRIRMVRADGSGETVLATGLTAALNPVFRPSDGNQILIRGQATDGTWGLYLMGRDGTKLTRLAVDPGFQSDPAYQELRDNYFWGGAWSADGRTLLYHTPEPRAVATGGLGFRIHMATIGPTGEVMSDKVLVFDAAADDEFEAAFVPSMDGITYQTAVGGVFQSWRVSLTLGATPVALGPQALDLIVRVPSPDGTSVLLVTGNPATVTHVDLGSGTQTPFTAGSDVAWQRAAQSD